MKKPQLPPLNLLYSFTMPTTGMFCLLANLKLPYFEFKPHLPHPPFLLQSSVFPFFSEAWGILCLGGLLLEQVARQGRADHQGLSLCRLDSAREQSPVLGVQTVQGADTQIHTHCPPISCLHSDPALFPTLGDLSGE